MLSACVQVGKEGMWAFYLNIGRCFQRYKWKGRHQLLLDGHTWVWYLIATLAFLFLFFKQLWWLCANNDSSISLCIPLLTLQGWWKEGAVTTLVSRDNKFDYIFLKDRSMIEKGAHFLLILHSFFFRIFNTLQKINSQLALIGRSTIASKIILGILIISSAVSRRRYRAEISAACPRFEITYQLFSHDARKHF